MKSFEEIKAIMEQVEATDSRFYLHVVESDDHKELCLTLGTKHGNDTADFYFPPRDDEERELTEMGREQLELWCRYRHIDISK